MAEPTATMSGANDAARTAAHETPQNTSDAAAVNDQLEDRPSLPSAQSAAPEATSPQETPAPQDATADASAASAKAAGRAPGTAGSSATTDTIAPSSTDAAPAAAAGVVQDTPRKPPPAVVARSRADSLAINADGEGAAAASSANSGLVCNITLLLPNGNRHPFRIDDHYLTKRGVDVPDTTDAGRKDPFSISVYKLKELILREWREEWDGKPASPSSIRLIHFGKLLDDKEQLKKYHFSADAPNVVHMSVKPPEMIEDEEAAKGKTSTRETRSRDGGSGCCVIL